MTQNTGRTEADNLVGKLPGSYTFVPDDQNQDEEIVAIRHCLIAVSFLDGKAAGRVARYLADRFSG